MRISGKDENGMQAPGTSEAATIAAGNRRNGREDHLVPGVAAAWFTLSACFSQMPGAWLFLAMMAGNACLLVLSVAWLVFLRRLGRPPVRVAGLAVLWTVVALVAGNTAAALVGTGSGYWTAFEPHSRLGWYPQKNLHRETLQAGRRTYRVSTDAWGHRRSPVHDATPVSGRLAVLVQGDSNTFGYGLEAGDTIASHLARLLDTPEVFNAGVSGFDVNHYHGQYAWLDDAFTIERRVVLLNLSNDFTFSALATPYYIRRPFLFVSRDALRLRTDWHNRYPVQAYDHRFIPPYSKWDSLIHEPTASWADRYPAWLLASPLARNWIRKLDPPWQAWRTGDAAGSELQLSQPSWALLRPTRWPEPYRSYARDFPYLLGALEAQHRGTVVCLIPMRVQAVDAAFQSARQEWIDSEVPADDISRTFLSHEIVRACRRRSMVYIDLLDVFRAAPDPGALYQQDGVHLTAEGARLAAEAIARRLQDP